VNAPLRAQQAQHAEMQQQVGYGAIQGTARDVDFERLLQREWSPREVLEDENLAKMTKVAEMLASSRVSVPDHLRGNVGDCMAIVTQAMLWNMNPFAVAQKTHLVNGRLGYEAQLVNAVLQASGLVRSMPRYEYRGDGEGLECRVAFVPRGESEPLWGEWLPMRAITTRNSPLWKTNQRQQLGYLQIKNWARAFAPGAILGVYTTDELEDIATFGGAVNRETGEIPPPPPAASSLGPYNAEAFTKNLPAWAKAVESGKKTPGEVLTMVSSKGTLTEEQKAAILSLRMPPPETSAGAATGATTEGAPPAQQQGPADDGHDDFRRGMDTGNEGGGK